MNKLAKMVNDHQKLFEPEFTEDDLPFGDPGCLGYCEICNHSHEYPCPETKWLMIKEDEE